MRLLKIAFVLIVVAAAFASGFVVRGVRFERAAVATNPGERRILYYIDPMHPGYKSDKSGTAPDCGMQLEPVYAEAAAAAGVPRQLPL